MAGIETTIQIKDGNGTLKTMRAWSEASDGSGPYSFMHMLVDIGQAEYETVAASQTAQTLGATGATGDYLAGMLIVPTSTSPGAVTVSDGSSSPDIAITVFAGGASSLSNLASWFAPLGIRSVSGAWKVTTGANVSVIAIGNFT
jgi:hypothetical protein